MANERTFVDAAGVEWRVYEHETDAPSTSVRDAGASLDSRPSRCLIFEARNERRLMCPPPHGWQSASDEQMADFCQRAETEEVGEQDDLERPT